MDQYHRQAFISLIFFFVIISYADFIYTSRRILRNEKNQMAKKILTISNSHPLIYCDHSKKNCLVGKDVKLNHNNTFSCNEKVNLFIFAFLCFLNNFFKNLFHKNK